MLVAVGCEKKEICRKVPRFKRDISADMLERADKLISIIKDKETLLWHLKNPSGYVRSQVITRLGEICCADKPANHYDYEVFAKALFEDGSFMVGNEAVKALAKIKTPMAVALLVQALGTDIGQVRAEAEKALDMLAAEEDAGITAGRKTKNWVKEIMAGTLEIIDPELRDRIKFYQNDSGREENEME